METRSIQQTGVVLIAFKDGTEKGYPLFSLKLQEESIKIEKAVGGKVKVILATNDCLNHTVAHEISLSTSKGFLPENLMSEVRSGFSEIYGWTGEPISSVGLSYA